MELAVHVDLGECGPLRIEFEPLADALITKNIEGLDVAIATWLKGIDEAACKFALGSIQCALNEHHARVVPDQVFDLTEGQLLLLLKESLDKVVQLSDLRCELLWGDTSDDLWHLFVWQDYHKRWDTFDVEVLHKILSRVTIDPVEQNSRGGCILAYAFGHHLLDNTALFIPLGCKQDGDDFVCCGSS